MDTMDHIGLANVFEKKECMMNGEKQIYYKQVDSVVGFPYHFANTGKRFIIISGKFAGRSIDETDPIYKIGCFKSFSKLINESNHSFDYNEFMNWYRKWMNCYFSYDNNTYREIVDADLLQKISEIDNDYSNIALNGNTDIAEMYTTIKKTIVSQDEQIMKILTSLFKNQKVIHSSLSEDVISKLKENIIVYGPTGTGKTEILKRISKIYRVPMVIKAATSYSETGYIGKNITDMLEDLYLESGKNIEQAQKAILLNSGARSLKTIFDEIISGALFEIFAGEYSAISLSKPVDGGKAYTLTNR